MSDKETRDRLHRELDELLPRSARTRSYIRMIGHCLIDLGLMTSVECGYEHCIMETRKFKAYVPREDAPRLKYIQDRMHPTIDHVVEIDLEGGSDLPDNLMFVHLGCNSSKARRRAKEHPSWAETQARRGFATAWQRDREKMLAAVQSPEARAKRVASFQRTMAEKRRLRESQQNC